MEMGSPRKRRRTVAPVYELPLLPRRDAVVYPNLLAQLVVVRNTSLRAIEEAMGQDRAIIVVGRRKLEGREVAFDDLYQVGTKATIGRVLKMPDGTTSIWLHGEERVRIGELVHSRPFFKVRATPLKETTAESMATHALMRAVLALLEKCVHLSPTLPEEFYVAAMNATEPGWMADLIASSLDLKMAQHQEILETLDSHERLQQVSVLVAKELEVLELQSKIHSQVQEEVDKTHREFFLREQMRAIQKELGEVDPQTKEMEGYRSKISGAHMSPLSDARAKEELERLQHIPPASPEGTVVRTYLDWLIQLPWAKETRDNLDLRRAARALEENHYGLKQVKERILEYIAVRKISQGRLRSPVLCFVGAPGVGKTSLGMSIAAALGRKFVRLSLGGVRDEAEIRGHRRTYVGALPGRILQTMRTAGTINPVFMLDEVDKVGMDFRGDPSSALLEVLDPEQNHAFSDHFLEVPYNLSKVLFITTANILDPVLPALRDRMEVIELPGYTEEEKLEIARRFLIPKQLRQHGLKATQIRCSLAALRRVIREYTREAGVRNLEREIGSICRKIARALAEGKRYPRNLLPSSVPRYLGVPRYSWGTAEEQDEVGVATGVARTEAGGDVLSVEVTLMEGKGNLILTGQLGEVMRESAQAALSFSRSRAREFHLGSKYFAERDIHIHVPVGAVPKDGPSAGVTMATALVSALTSRPTRRDVAMTGEITLRGRVLPVGGVKEKVLAVHRAGIRTFVLPERNKKDLADIPLKVKKGLNFVFVRQMEEVLGTALAQQTEARE